MAKIAIIGSGIAGLSAAYHLHKQHEVTIYEKAPRIGGHTRTRVIDHGGHEIAVDTGFIVFNEQNYPNLTQLFQELGVEVAKSDMSFALTVRDGWLEWGAQNLNAVFGQRQNLLRPAFFRLVQDVLHFNAHAESALDEAPQILLGDLIARMGLSDWFRWYYLLPMAGAIWSCPPRQMLEFPAASFIRFFANHGLLSLTGQPQWYTVKGGAQRYIERLTAPFSAHLRTDCAAAEIRRSDGGVQIRDSQGQDSRFDHVVIAAHADDARSILADASDAERAALQPFHYQTNRAVLHKDPQFMPKRRRCWASWVYHSDGRGDEAAITVSYWMNRLQSIDKNHPVFVTLNPARDIPDEHIFDVHDFSHPVFDQAAVAAQAGVRALQGVNNTWFCGAHLGYGFHEDGLVSGMEVAAALNAPGERRFPKPVEIRKPTRARTPLPAGRGAMGTAVAMGTPD